MFEWASYHDSQAEACWQLLHASVQAIPSSFYTLAQKEVWSPANAPVNWAARLITTQPTLLFSSNTSEKQLIGFAELIPASSYLDCFYIHPDWQGYGAGKFLYQQIEQQAKSHQLPSLAVDVSLNAIPFFLRQGFIEIHQQANQRDGITLYNVRMVKSLV